MDKNKVFTIYRIVYIIITGVLLLSFLLTVIIGIARYEFKDMIFILYLIFHLMGISIAIVFLGLNVLGIIMYKKPFFVIVSFLTGIWISISAYYWISGRIMVMM